MPEPTLNNAGHLYHGDNIEILRDYIRDQSIDLVYLDPPFCSNKMYGIMLRDCTGNQSKSKINAFDDTWKWDRGAEEIFSEVVKNGPEKLSGLMQSFKGFLGTGNAMAYLTMMAPRLVELRRVMKQTASIYLHCDPGISHYLKILMDAVFGANNFRNEIIWCYASGGAPKRDFARKHDIIFRYSRSNKYNFNPQYRPYSEGTLQRGLTKVKGPKYKLREEGAIMQDWWTDIQKTLSPTAKERLGYPTQKPEALLERIIRAGSNEGDIVLDPFCGSGTTIAVAQRLNRSWVGIDFSDIAIELAERRLNNLPGNHVFYDVTGKLFEGKPILNTGIPVLSRNYVG